MDNGVVGESFYQLGDLPIMCCVLTLEDGRFVVGFSFAPPGRFDEDIQRGYSRRSAYGNHRKRIERQAAAA